MPVLPAIGAFLSTAGGAAVASAGIGALGTMYASSQANSAARDAATAQTQAQQQALDLQRQQHQQTQANLAPYMQAGAHNLQNLDAFLAQTIPGYRSMYAQQSGPDWNAYLAANPDAAAWVQAKAQQPDGQGKTAEQLAQWHYQLDGSRREVPQVQAAAPTQPAPTQPAPEFTRPDPGPAPSAMSYGVGFGPPSALEYLQNYKESDAYLAKKKIATRDVNSGYAAKGILRSGNTIGSLATKINDLLDQDRESWVRERLSALGYDQAGYRLRQNDYQTALNQYNTNTTRSDNIFNTDRNFNYGSLFDMIRLGQNSAVGAGNFGQSYANQGGNILQNMGQTQANYANQVAANNIYTAGQYSDILNNALNGWRNPGANYNINPIDPYGYGSDIWHQRPANVPGLTPTPNFNHLLGLEG